MARYEDALENFNTVTGHRDQDTRNRRLQKGHIDTGIGRLVNSINNSGGIFRAQKWMCRIHIPDNDVTRSAWGNLGAIWDTSWIRFRCESMNIPGKALSTQQTMRPGYERKLPYMEVYEDVEVTFVCTSHSGDNSKLKDNSGYYGLPEKRFFDAWMNSIVDPSGSYFNYRNEYATDIQMVLYDDSNTQVCAFVFKNSYPIVVGSMVASMMEEQAAILPITFNIDKWEYYDTSI